MTAPGGIETASITYEWDDENHLVAKHTEGVAGAAQHAYGYDRAGRLVSWDNGSAVHTYEWDAAGNLTRDGPVSAVFNERNQLLSKADVEYSYTPRGTLASRTSDGVSTLVEFNAFDELVADGGTDYRYDALNRLVSAGGNALTYVGSGIKVASDGQGEYTYTPGGLPLGVAQGGVSALAWTDVHTDLVGLVDPGTGVLAGSRSYSPFGQRQAEAGTQPALGFQHQYTDPDSGNVNMGARWYQPGTGTFASRDTAGLDPRDLGNSNRYAYASADPLGHIDPSGYLAVAPVVPIVAAIAGSTAVRQVGTRLITRGAAIVGGIVGDWASDLFKPKKIRGIPRLAPQSVPLPQIAWSIWNSLEISRIALLAGFNFPYPSGSRPNGPGKPTGGNGGPIGGWEAASIVNPQLLRAFFEQLRRQRLENLVNTPHP